MTATALAAVGSNANENGTLLISGTAVSASGTSVDFTGIPSWAKRITVMFNEVSTNGSSFKLVQIGSSSVSTSGYNSTGSFVLTSVNTTSSTAGFVMYANSSTDTLSGHIIITLIGSNTWVSSHTLRARSDYTCLGGGSSPALSGVLDRVRITTVNGTDTFDAGVINVFWE